MSYPYNIRALPRLTAVANGVTLATGDVLTGSDVHDLIVDDGVKKVTTEEISGQKGACTLYRYIDGTATRSMSTSYGDRMYFQHSITDSPDSVTMLYVNADVIVFEMQWSSYTLSPGAVLIDQSYGYGYVEGTSTIKRMSTVRLYKRVRVESGSDGYFVGYRTSPFTGPHFKDLPGAYSNDNTWGEKEISCDGGDSAVAFSSNGITARHPAWGAGAAWTAPVIAAVGGNRVAWMGIDDPNYAPWTDVDVIATQAAGFPNTQSSGRCWVASIHEDGNLVRYMVPIIRGEIGSWQESAVARGTTVFHFMHDTGHPYQVFLGAFGYTADTSSSFANEPTSDLRSTMATKAAAVSFPVP